MRRVVHPKSAPKPKGPYSPAIVSGGFVFVAGQASINPLTGEFEFGDIQSETRRTLQNIRSVLEAAGCSLDDVVRAGVYLSNLEDFGAMNEVYQEFFGQNPPARTTVGVDLPKIKVEIDCIARVRSREKKKTKLMA